MLPRKVLLKKERHLIELEGWGGVALNEHVATGSLVFHCTVLLLDLHNPSRVWSIVKNSSPIYVLHLIS